MTFSDLNIRYRNPIPEDGQKVWKLIRDAGTLDLNSAYCYLLLSDYYRDTCVIAEDGHEIAGFLSSFYSPREERTLFVWQIAVADAYRKRGIGKAMLSHLLDREIHRKMVYLEATVSPANIASDRLFQSMARDQAVSVQITSGYKAQLFPEQKHEDEPLYRIGPFSSY